MVVTRFAPSPTGFLHIGGARTALFNYLFARHFGGSYYLRIEDTDKERSSDAAIQAIIDGLSWLNITHDGAIMYQSHQQKRHQEVAHSLVQANKAYYCDAANNPLPNNDDMIEGAAIRLKIPRDQETTIHDMVQGTITLDNNQLEDVVLLRADGNPTYMLAVVCDDYDMGITHVIRGADHITNAFKQYHIYNAMGWDAPIFGHIALIHGPDGGKLSKRHGALGVDAYKDMGYIADAINNYILRLGWAHGDDEIINQHQAIEWFDGTHIGKSPAQFDFDKLKKMNHHYIQHIDTNQLCDIVMAYQNNNDVSRDDVKKYLPFTRNRAHMIGDIIALTLLFTTRPTGETMDEKSYKIVTDNHALYPDIAVMLQQAPDGLSHEAYYDMFKDFAAMNELSLSKVLNPVRAKLTGKNASPSALEMLEGLGKSEAIFRLLKD